MTPEIFYLIDSIQIPITLPTPLHSNNQPAINLITTGNISECSKYINTKYRFICDHHKSTSYIPTDEQPADGFFKLGIERVVVTCQTTQLSLIDIELSVAET